MGQAVKDMSLSEAQVCVTHRRAVSAPQGLRVPGHCSKGGPALDPSGTSREPVFEASRGIQGTTSRKSDHGKGGFTS